jgi:protein involved in polysaccharide export with SLBB domain
MISQISRLLLPLALVTSSLFLVANAADTQVNPADYRLGATDRVRIKVFEWRPARDEIFEWKALNDEYVVGTSGNVSLPMIGEVAAKGLTTNELSHAIGERMITSIGLVEMPTISVEIVKYRPFYVVGRVQTPGEYAFRPNLTVIQAFSLAGGNLRREGATRLDREAISGKGEVDILAQERRSLLARRARIEADLHDGAEIKFPAELDANDPVTKVVMEQERSILAAIRSAFDSQLQPLDKLKVHLDNEVNSLVQQLSNHDQKAKLAASELEGVENLLKRKLTVEPRRLQAKRNVFELDGGRMQLDMALMRVRQDISKADFAISELRSKHTNEATAELRLTQAKLDEVSGKYQVARRLLANTAESEGDVSLGGDGQGERTEMVFKIQRITGDGQAVELIASDSTAVQPGDTIKVEVRMIEGPTVSERPDSPRG